ALGARELAVGNDLRTDAVDLVQQFRQRAVGHLGAYLGGGLPVAEAAVPAQRGVGAVGPALLLAQNEKQPCVGAAAQDLRHEATGVIDRIGREDRRVPRDDVRLGGSGAVHQQ